MRKWLVGLIAAIAVISVGGVGFAAFTSTVQLKLNGAAGSLNVEWTGPASPATVVVEAIPSDAAVCNVALTSGSIVTTFKNFAPNDQCTVPLSSAVNLTNLGTLAGTTTYTNQFKWLGGDSCIFFFSSNLNGYLFGGGPIPANANLPFSYAYYLQGGNGCEGSTITWWLNVTATAGT